jgi:hypothetical protein
LVEGRIHRNAGVVDDHIQAAEVFDGSFDEAAAILLTGNVRSNRDRLCTAIEALASRFIQRLLIPRGQSQLCASPGKLTRKLLADAGRSAGDDDCLVLELHRSCLWKTSTILLPAIQPG